MRRCERISPVGGGRPRSLSIAGLALDAEQLEVAKVGILSASLVAAMRGMLSLRLWLRRGK